MVRLRLRRVGSKGQPSYRVVAANREAPRDGRFNEILGFYNPRTQPATIELNEARIYDWMSKGAQPSDSVSSLFRTIGLVGRYERFKQGEALDILVAEAKSAKESRIVNPKTERVGGGTVVPSQKRQKGAPLMNATLSLARGKT
jgi:small subunit ribosomal protein S16